VTLDSWSIRWLRVDETPRVRQFVAATGANRRIALAPSQIGGWRFLLSAQDTVGQRSELEIGGALHRGRSSRSQRLMALKRLFLQALARTWRPWCRRGLENSTSAGKPNPAPNTKAPPTWDVRASASDRRLIERLVQGESSAATALCSGVGGWGRGEWGECGGGGGYEGRREERAFVLFLVGI